ncbi:MAG: transcriptional regulator [Frankiales bacterium]|nr:transcriptional regulator [Frankiales bacterium]
MVETSEPGPGVRTVSATYGQFCPVAKAMELLDERWTLLVVRELVAGSQHFNELRRGLPRMSPALLTKRLRMLERAGVVERLADGPRIAYELTAAGLELATVVLAVGRWGMRWLPVPGDDDLDPHLLMWDVHRRLDVAAVPPGRVVLAFRFSDVLGPSARWWLVISDEEVDVCSDDPGFAVDVTVHTDLRTLTMVWRADRTWESAVRAGDLEVIGPPLLRQALPSWLMLSSLAATPRPAGAA